MACLENCSATDAILLFTVSDGASYSLTGTDAGEEFISFGSTESMMNAKRNRGSVRYAGSRYVMQEFTVNVFCSDEAIDLERAYLDAAGALCGDAFATSTCCSDRDFTDVILKSVTPPVTGSETGEYEFTFEGIPV